MKSKKKKLNFTKAEIQEVKEFENPEFILRIAIVNYDDLKKWNLIDSLFLLNGVPYRKSVQKHFLLTFHNNSFL